MNKSPITYLGSKQRIASEIWRAFGDCDLFVECFFGSGAVLLNRPSSHRRRVELINDLDCYVINFWRAVKYAPNEVAAQLDLFVSEIDLYARSKHLIEQRGSIEETMRDDPRWYDVELAAWFAWGMSVAMPGFGVALNRMKPKVHSGQGLSGILHESRQPSSEYLSTLARRLERVTSYCGDWSRCLTSSVIKPRPGETNKTGVFLDPPYNASHKASSSDAYAHDRSGVSDDARAWCVDNGHHSYLRIALCGHDDEHSALEALGWSVMSWDKRSTMGGTSKNKAERVWFSPHCLRVDQLSLF